jgi:DnaJ-class molecular chaperone
MSTELSNPDPARSQCTPCRGTGVVISNLGGERSELTCPWCGGEGKHVPGRDAQQSAAENRG